MQTNISYNYGTKQPQNLALCEMQSFRNVEEKLLTLARPINQIPVGKSWQKQEKSLT